jgi:hypothetical protein
VAFTLIRPDGQQGLPFTAQRVLRELIRAQRSRKLGLGHQGAACASGRAAPLDPALRRRAALASRCRNGRQREAGRSAAMDDDLTNGNLTGGCAGREVEYVSGTELRQRDRPGYRFSVERGAQWAIARMRRVRDMKDRMDG